MRRYFYFGHLLCLCGAIQACGGSKPLTDNSPTGAPQSDVIIPENVTGSTCRAFSSNGLSGQGVKLTNTSGGLSNTIPVAMHQVADAKPFWIMAEITGRISRFPISDTVTEAQREVLLDLSDAIYAENEAGFLDLTLDPDFLNNKTAYASYTVGSDASGLTHVIARLIADSDWHFRKAPVPVLSRSIPNNFHIGGHLAFGVDRMLYIGTGFAGTDASPDGFAENMQSLHGKFLRIDPSRRSGDGTIQYAIPTDNPFVGVAGARPEIFAYGFRNPWRWSIDAATGLIWVGDVGASREEEVDIVHAGDNYGWPAREGSLCNTKSQLSAGACTVPNQTEPILTYKHTEGSCITGGHVYRGRAIPELVGHYIYSDCTAGKIWSLSPAVQGNASTTLLVTAPSGITSFAEDLSGELYVLGRDSIVYRLDALMANAQEKEIPQRLSVTGCAGTSYAFDPPENLFPYSVAAPFWSDNATKQRWVSLPKGQTLQLLADESIDSPKDTVYVKRFSKGGTPVETRLFMRLLDGTWAGFSYAWNPKLNDGELVGAAGAIMPLSDGSSWRYPSRTECLTCHSKAAGNTLGTQIGQFNVPVNYSNLGNKNQLQLMADLKLFSGPLPGKPDDLTRFISPEDATQSFDLRARTYLHVNCSVCHRPGGMGLGPADFRITNSLKAMKICGITPSYGTFGVSDAQLMFAGRPDKSMIPIRMRKTDAARMPTISSDIVDLKGIDVIEQWITGSKSCP